MNTNLVSQNNLYKFTSVFLISLAIFSFFFGFYLDENSAGAGGHAGDFSVIYSNFQIFLKYDLEEAIVHHDYFDSRPPTSYILHKLFNPFFFRLILSQLLLDFVMKLFFSYLNKRD